MTEFAGGHGNPGQFAVHCIQKGHQPAGQQPQAEQPTGAITPDQSAAHVTIDERQNQPEPEDAPEVDSRRQLPPVEADFVQRPRQRRQQ